MATPTTYIVNRMPASTWDRLGMNYAEVVIPAAHETAEPEAVKFTVPAGVEYFERTIEDADHHEVGDLDLIGQLDRDLEALGVAEEFENGIGEEAAQMMHNYSTRRLTFRVPAGMNITEPVVVRVNAQDGAAVLASVGVIAEPGSHVRVCIHVDADQNGVGVIGTSLHVLAKEDSFVQVDSLLTGQELYKHLDNMGIYEADRAQVQVNQTVLGAGASYTGLACDLAGEESECKVDTRYLGHDAQIVDFNYIMRQRGRNTNCVLNANGVLIDEAKKTLRGTIDLINGCAGSTGSEQEMVLLASEQVSNKTIPVILCDEDDVQGAHGASIGHVTPEHLFYLQSRGLTIGQIEALFAEAMLDYAATHTFDRPSWEAVGRLGAKVLDGSYMLPGEED